MTRRSNWRIAGLPISYDGLQGEPEEFKYFVSEDAEIIDDHSGPVQSQDRPKSQDEELIEINLTEEGKEA